MRNPLSAITLAMWATMGIASAAPLRTTLPLDGTWQIAEGTMTDPPARFDHSVSVPGLVDMAVPAFDAPGPKVRDREQLSQKDPKRDAFWYRRTFTVDDQIPAVAQLKVAKAMFGTRVFLNGKLLGEHLPCFTPGYFDAKPALKTGQNEVVIRIGADRDAVGRAIPDGFDFEKTRYIPGSFDSVELILSGGPHIANVQVVPDIARQEAKLRVDLDGNKEADVIVEIREAKSGKLAGMAEATGGRDVVVPVANCHLWSPEDPFRYTATVRTAGDEFTTRFGMREFHFDPATRRAVLNGKPYFMRGSNITLYRFFEDSECGHLPWDEKWVRELHERAKDMHWNCLRYCIGFPPEKWYDIADETGILIQDEFPIWYLGDVPKEMQTDELAREFTEMMQAHWNHPCVVIWDACNETKSEKTGAAFQRVRSLDLSGRPWDDGWHAPALAGDSIESHPYHFQNPNFKFAGLATVTRTPQYADGKHAVIINEYGWLWLNRDGTPTTLTQKLYQNLLGTHSTTAQRRHLYALYGAAETEFWRAHRQAAAVMQFTALGYSRTDGQTSDHWLPGGVAKLEWEPEFYKYVRDAFAPIGAMLDFWSENADAGTTARIPFILTNDLEPSWNGEARLTLRAAGKDLASWTQNVSMDGFGQVNGAFDVVWPQSPGRVELDLEIAGAGGKPVHSLRELTIQKP